MKYKEQPAFEKNDFKVGDYVRVYDEQYQFDCAISAINDCFVSFNTTRKLHFKQCRLLLPVKPREFYLIRDCEDDTFGILEEKPNNVWKEIVKVREVLEDE